MYILGLNSVYHQSAACLVADGHVVAAAEEERFTRVKQAKEARVDNPHELPAHAIRYCLEASGIRLGDVGHVAYSFNPTRRLRDTRNEDHVHVGDWGSAKGERRFFSSLRQVPGLLAEEGFRGEFHWLDHHLCHAASAYYGAPFERAAVLTVDGIGETTTCALALGEGASLEVLQEVSYPSSLGFLWEKLTRFLGFDEVDACKVMGLSAYGDPERYREALETLVSLKPGGGFELDNRVLRFRLNDFAPLEELLGTSRRKPGEGLKPEHGDLAAALQWVTDGVLDHVVVHLAGQTRSQNLCMAGGVALNCVSNRRIYEEGPFEQMFIQPAAHDAGTALGAALFVAHSVCDLPERWTMSHAYLGPVFSCGEIERALAGSGLAYERFADAPSRAADLLVRGELVGWFDGRMEFGPRALGARSLLADASHPAVRERLNRLVKHREPFRPFAASILAEEADAWFRIEKRTAASDFMLMAYPAQPGRAERIPAVMHEDGTCRIQTVRASSNPRYRDVIQAVHERTGVPMVLNTSFNDSEPIVCTPEDAIRTFRRTGIDHLVLNDFVVSRIGNAPDGHSELARL